MFALVGIAIIYVSNLQFSAGIYIGLLSALATVIVSVLNKKIVSGYAPAAGNNTVPAHRWISGLDDTNAIVQLFAAFKHTGAAAVGLAVACHTWYILYCAYFYSLYKCIKKRVSAFTVNLTLTLEPVYGIILAFAVFSENKYLSHYFYIGFALILCSCSFTNAKDCKTAANTGTGAL